MTFVPKDTHISPHNIFVSALILRCKLCIPLGTSLELLRLLLRRYKLCIPLGTSLELLRLLLRRYQRWLFAVCSAFLLERLWSRKLTLRSLRNDFLWLRQTYSAFLRTTFCCFEEFSIVRRSSLLSQIFKLQQLKPVKKIYFPCGKQRNYYMKFEKCPLLHKK